jgi:hypothetical protein
MSIEPAEELAGMELAGRVTRYYFSPRSSFSSALV